MQQSDLMGQLYQQRWELFYVLCSLTQTAKLSYTKTIRLHNFQTYFSEHNCFICFPTKISKISAKPQWAIVSSLWIKHTYSGLLYFVKRNKTKWNLYFAKWNSAFSWKTFVKKLLQTFYFPTIIFVVAEQWVFGPHTKTKQFSQLFCRKLLGRN